MKIAFISCSFGEGGSTPARFSRHKMYDYFLFSDKDQSDFNTSWEVINVKNHPIVSHLPNNIKRSRYHKFLAWKDLTGYDFIFYCDAHLSPNHELDWGRYAREINQHNFKLCQDKHSFDISEECGILADLILIVGFNRDTCDNVLKTVDFFRKNFPNVPLKGGPYYQNTIIGYNPKSEKVCNFLYHFWSIYHTSDTTYRDQPLWNVLLRYKNFTPISTPIITANKFLNTGIYGNHSYVQY